MKYIERFVDLLECKSEKTWLNSITQIGNDLGFEQTLFAVTFNRKISLDEAYYRGNFSAQWFEFYNRKHLVNIDPRIAHSLAHSTPLFWEPAIFSSRQQKEMYEEAICHGMRSGVTLPCHGANGEVGMLCFTSEIKPSRTRQAEMLRVLPSLSMMRDFAFEASLRFAKPANHDAAPALTKRELECLKWCATGKTSWEIAKILRCSEATVNFHFGNLRLKFNATSRRQVVVKAINCGLLHSKRKWHQHFYDTGKL